jgi:hypothetical protein
MCYPVIEEGVMRSICGIAEASNTCNCSVAAGAGDSGGPVHRYGSGGTIEEGTISFGGGTASNCSNYSVGYPRTVPPLMNPARQCYTLVGFTDIADTLSYYGINYPGLAPILVP